MKISANSIEAQQVFAKIYTVLASYLGQPDHIKLFVSRKKLNLDAYVYTIEQLMARLITIRILEDTALVSSPVLQSLLIKHEQAGAQEETLWDDLLDLFLDLRQSPLISDCNEEIWSLSGVDELHINNETARSLIDYLYQLDFSNGFAIVDILEGWIAEMSKSFRQGLESSFSK